MSAVVEPKWACIISFTPSHSSWRETQCVRINESQNARKESLWKWNFDHFIYYHTLPYLIKLLSRNREHKATPAYFRRSIDVNGFWHFKMVINTLSKAINNVWWTSSDVLWGHIWASSLILRRTLDVMNIGQLSSTLDACSRTLMTSAWSGGWRVRRLLEERLGVLQNCERKPL